MKIRECKTFNIKKELTKAQIRELETEGIFITEEPKILIRRKKCKRNS